MKNSTMKWWSYPLITMPRTERNETQTRLVPVELVAAPGNQIHSRRPVPDIPRILMSADPSVYPPRAVRPAGQPNIRVPPAFQQRWALHI